MGTLPIPAGPEDLTPQWLTDALRAGGALDGARVRSARCEVAGRGVGFIGQIVRVALEYQGEAPGAPASLIAKLSSPSEGARTIAALYGLYEREVRFYQELARDVGMRVPTCYYSDVDPASAAQVLLLEDVSSLGHVGDQVRGCTAAEAAPVLRELGRFQAGWWASPRLEGIPWLPAGTDLVNGAMHLAYPGAWPRFLELFGGQLPAALREALPGLGPRLVAALAGFADRPLTLLHGDFRLDNLVLCHPGSTHVVAVMDWQSPNRGWGIYDAAYFLSGGLEPAERRAEERALLREYHDALTAGGVRGYSWEQCWEDYPLALLICLAIGVVNSATLEMANDRAVQLFRAGLDRLAAAVTDRRALEVLPAG